MNQLLTISDEVLSENIGPIGTPEHDSLEIINYTLNGEPHIQVIGTPQRAIPFEILATDIQANRISLLKATGAKFKLIKENTVYTGVLIGKPPWKRISKHFYTADLKLNVLEEGTL